MISVGRVILSTAYQESHENILPANEDDDGAADRWVFVGRGCFRRVMLDEAQKAKTVLSLITRQILSLETELRTLLSATPMDNKASDLYGLLRLL